MALRKGFAACSLSGMVGTGLLLSKGCPHPGFCSGCDSRAPNQLGRGQVHQSTWVPGHHLTPGHSCQQVSPLYNILWQPCLPSMGLSLLPHHLWRLSKVTVDRLCFNKRGAPASQSHIPLRSRAALTAAPPTAQRIGARAGALLGRWTLIEKSIEENLIIMESF